jgi:hypothetical protein
MSIPLWSAKQWEPLTDGEEVRMSTTKAALRSKNESLPINLMIDQYG